MSALREIERVERGGVPVFWHPSPLPGDVTGTLMFRAGWADETLSTRGLTHAVEHLALFPFGRPEYHYNGYVGPTETVFWATGTTEEVCGFLREVAANLRALPLDRLETERRVLRAEAGRDKAGDSSRLLSLRFGPRGYGLHFWQELGLRWVGAGEIERWAAERFVRGNAAVWLSAEVPDDLELGLPEGPRREPPAPEPLRFALPAHLADGAGGVVLACWGERSVALGAAVRIAGDRLYDRLRRDAGLSYSAYGDPDTYGGRWTQALLGSDCLDKDALQVRDEILRVAREMGEDGPTEEELERYRRNAGRFFTDPEALRSQLDYSAYAEVHGLPGESAADTVATLDALTAADVAQAGRIVLDTAIVLSPPGLSVPPAGFAEYRVPDSDPVDGRRFRANVRRSRLRTTADEVVVGEAGVTYRTAERTVTIRWEDAVLVETRPRGAIRILGLDEAWVEFGPAEVEDGEAAKALALERLAHLPLVPTRGAVNEERLAPLLHERLGERPVVDSEAPPLFDELDEDEDVVEVLQADRDGRTGLMTLTERRLLWSTSDGGSDGLWHEWGGVESAGARKRFMAADVLRFSAGGEELEFAGVWPPGAAQRAAEAAQALIAAARGAA